MVSIDITRRTYTSESIMSTLLVMSSKGGPSFHGYALENIKAGSHHNKTPTPPGTYQAKVRTNGHLGWRIELLHVPGHTHIEIHIGNYPANSHGCFLPGKTKVTNAVGHSGAAMKEIKSIVDADSSRTIAVNLVGSNTKP